MRSLPPQKKGSVHNRPSSQEIVGSAKRKQFAGVVELAAKVSGATTNWEVDAIRAKIGKLLKFSTFEPEQRYWLDTGYPDLNATLGSRDMGIPYGKIYELSGEEHGGKTALGIILAGMCQRDGAAVGYIDLEDSYDIKWSTTLGLDCSQVLALAPKLIQLKKKGEVRLESAEMLFAEAEIAMAEFAAGGSKKQFWILDSVANLQTEMAIEAGTVNRNMRVNVDRAQFLSSTLPKWASLAAQYNAMIFLINQLRDKVGMVWGEPTYSPGGRALRHACAIRAKVRRVKGGRLLHNKQLVGIYGAIKNVKNKAGQGSVERCETGFKIRWSKNPARVTFMPLADVEEI